MWGHTQPEHQSPGGSAALCLQHDRTGNWIGHGASFPGYPGPSEWTCMTLARSVRQPFVWAIFHAGVDTDKPRLADSSARARVDRLRTVDLRPYRRNVLVTLTCLSAHCSTLFS